MKKNTIVFTGGGSAGHVTPNIAGFYMIMATENHGLFTEWAPWSLYKDESTMVY
ncbi:hypothetical protein V7200_00800 [Cytobacillus firmus]|uniref:UDP-N-acetylglucosamine--N-acetylmuramyl-(Pentapeptide) pyrophosphoryl-undecaprenol N-acetylglucosamine transferase n=1 Tax=Cytobacillus firmus TaxID=1399 RepID=A0A800MS73_CYTFI|nr:hypothetical protein [Cytobacillus firmus]KAF0821427.1 UDP-N-acetylglucosamine--N-acetylmuramyl-(pentapeptide) pyrophosphoryl-undecaprenol N-acetylglucosamine transferase [Cytobacillus firmus]MDD9312157.1 hypothetical protein [Cytobacillus firmus]